jgi:hypothetical protein
VAGGVFCCYCRGARLGRLEGCGWRAGNALFGLSRSRKIKRIQGKWQGYRAGSVEAADAAICLVHWLTARCSGFGSIQPSTVD